MLTATQRILTGAVLLALLVLALAFSAAPVSAQPPECVGIGACLGFPDADDTSGKFVNVTRGLSSLGDVGGTQHVMNISLIIPESQTSFVLAIFDGDMGGTWDVVPTTGADNIHWYLYPDPNRTGNTTGAIWDRDATTMPDNGWFVTTIANTEAARNGGSGPFYYHLVANWITTNYTNEQNNFKVVVEGTPYLPAGSTIGFIGYGPNDPNSTKFPASTYDGSFSFRFLVPSPATIIDLYDGDMDRWDDSDDASSPNWPPNTGPIVDPNKWPPFLTSIATVAEGALPGNPPDDEAIGDPFRISPHVIYHVTAPDQSWTVTNWEPSGDKEWERFRIVKDGVTPGDGFAEDVTVANLPAGFYQWRWEGLDGRNTVFINAAYDIYPALGSIGNTVWYDDDGDGIWDQNQYEPGIAGVVVNLYLDANSDGILNSGDQLLGSQTTNSNGQYKFTGLTGAKYLVEVSAANFLPGGALFGLTQSSATFGESYGDHHNRATPWPVTIPTNLYYVKADFGYRSGGGAGSGDIGNQVWLDLDADGVFEPWMGEIGIAGVTINLYNSVGVYIGTQTTNANGQYLFPGLPYGTYIVDVTDTAGKLTGMSHTLGNQSQLVDNTSKADPYTVSLTGPSILTVDFGYVKKQDWCVSTYSLGPVGTMVTWVDANGNVTVRYNQSRAVNDNSYGVNSIGWKKIHRFKDLVNSDHAVFEIKNAAGTVVLKFGLDYISAKSGTPSGYASLGVSGGDGFMTTGNPAWILAWDSSLARNLNNTGYCVSGNCTVAGVNLKVDSPPADSSYNLTNPAAFGLWEFTNWYQVTISAAAFGPSGFGSAAIVDQHNSPSKILVENPQPCVPSGQTFTCSRPISSLTMIWDGSSYGAVRVKAWKGTVGSILLKEAVVLLGQELTVNGYAGSPNDVYWEIFDPASGAKLGESTFHVSCSDPDMNSGDDCGKYQGDGKGRAGYINKWILEGMIDSNEILDCTP